MLRLLTRLTVAAALILGAGAADAACLVEYKAKRDAPLRLHYGIIELSDANCDSPAAAVTRRIKGDGWSLLTVMGKLSRKEAEKRKADAGAFYLKY